MASDKELKKTFGKLRPLCIQILESPTAELLTDLKIAILNVNETALEELQDYLLFAFKILFNQLKNKPDKFKIQLFACLNALLMRSGEITESKLFLDLINQVVCNICPPFPNPQQQQGSSQNVEICEEIKLEGVLALDSLFANASFDILYKFYHSSPSLPFLGHAVSVLLGFIENERLRSLRLASMQTLLRISLCCIRKPQVECFENDGEMSNGKMETGHEKLFNGSKIADDNFEDDDLECSKDPKSLKDTFCSKHLKKSNKNIRANLKSLESLVGNIFVSFLPGVSMSLTRVALGDAKQGQLVTAFSIAVLTRILERTFSDELLADAKGKELTLGGGQEKYNELLVKKTDDWIDSTSRKLSFLMDKLTSLSSDDRWKVRLELLRMSDKLLLNCCKGLSRCSEKLLHILISSLVDEEPIVQQHAHHIVQSLRERMKDGPGQGLVDLVEDGLFRLVEDLPALLGSPSDRQKLMGLRLLHGHLEMLGLKSSSVISSSSHLEQLLRSFSNLLEFDCSNLIISDDTRDNLFLFQHGAIHQHPLPSYSFKKFMDDRVLEEAIETLNLIGRFCDLQTLVDQLLDTMLTSAKLKKQAAFCLVHILNGARSLVETNDPLCEDPLHWSKLEPIIDCVVDQILDKSTWTQACEPIKMLVDIQTTAQKPKSNLVSKLLVTEYSGDDYDSFTSARLPVRDSFKQSPKEAKEETVFACLLLDIIGSTALLAGLKFELKLTLALLPVLERMGSSRFEIQVRSHRTLLNMSWATSVKRRKSVAATNGNNISNISTTKVANATAATAATTTITTTTKDIQSNGSITARPSNFVVVDNNNDILVDTISEMLIRCSDYLMSSVLPCLRTVARNPGVLLALRVVIELGTPKLPLVTSVQLSPTSENNGEMNGKPSSPSSSPRAILSPHSSYDLSSHQTMVKIIYSSFKQILTSFDDHYSDFALDFWKLLLKLAILISKTVELEKLLTEITDSTGAATTTTTARPSTATGITRSSPTKAPSTTTAPTTITVNQHICATILTTKTTNGVDNNNRHSINMEKASRAEVQSKGLIDFVVELERNRIKVEGFNKSDEGDFINIFHDIEDEKKVRKQVANSNTNDKVEPPYYVGMLEQILERCQHFLISPDVQLRMIVLEVVSVVCPTLKPFQDNLLPMVHQVWPSFVKRFSDSEHFVCIKAFETLRIMTDSSGDFVRRRIVGEVMPKVISALQSLAKNSHNTTYNYRFSTACQFQKCILNNIGDLCRQADIQGQPLFDTICACIPHLSALQPLCLQEACIETFKEFIAIEPDTVWLLLTDVYCQSQVLTPPPGSTLQPIKLSGPTKRNEFADNVTVLQKILDEY